MLKTGSCIRLWRKQKSISLLPRFLSTDTNRKRICIVGSGPAGFYTAQHLLKNNLIDVDIFEKLPVPFGLIRYGVAPDHSEIKNCTAAFTQIALHDQCNFYGNINVGKDVMVSDLLEAYHAVILAFGASCDKALGIPGENCKNVLPARQIVGWYTGHPDFINEQIDLNTDTATVIGQGNVAVDVARILLQDRNKLKTTDIAEYAYEALKKSQIKRVVMVGRRGPLQAAFTIKEFRELSKLPNCHIAMHDPKVGKLFDSIQVSELNLERPVKRMLQLMTELYQQQKNLDPSQMEKSIELKYFRSPKEIIPNADGRVEKLVLRINEIEEILSSKSAKVVVTDKEDVVDCGLVIRSVGYKSFPIDPSIPFDNNKHLIPNERGRVIGKEGLYCSGWVKSGPIGVILSTMRGGFETGALLLKDIDDGKLSRDLPKEKEHIFNMLKQKGVKYVTFKDWEKIDKYELERGKSLGKEREKIYCVEEMLKVVGSN